MAVKRPWSGKYRLADERMERLLPKFWERVVRGDPSKCWEWIGGQHCGYGVILVPGEATLSIYAHRLAWRIAHGRWSSETAILCHTCDNKVCVNPAHLYEGDHRSNALDRWRPHRQRAAA